MELPLFKLTQYGVFDSRLSYKNVMTTPERVATEYEIEIFNEDCIGESYLDDHAVPIRRETIIITKPGLKRHSLFPIKCLNIHIVALNKEAEKIFEPLPSVLKSKNISNYEKIFNEIFITDTSDKQLFNLFLNKK